MIDVPITGTALEGHIAKREIIDCLSVDAVDKVSVFICQIPCVAATDAVIAAVEDVDFVSIKDRIAVSVDIDCTTGSSRDPGSYRYTESIYG